MNTVLWFPKYAKGGWNLLEIREPMFGQLAQDLEFESLKALARRHGGMENIAWDESVF